MRENVHPDLVGVEEAERILDSTPTTFRSTRLNLRVAQGRRLARDVMADRDFPSFDKSLMDGFAVRARDLQSTQVLQVVGEIAAGGSADAALGERQAMSIMTGAALPAGADAVVPIEDAQEIESGRVRIARAPSARANIALRGSDCRAAQVVLWRGMRLEAAQLAAAASVGAAEVDVFAPPSVAVLCTGDELVPIDATPTGSQIRNSNEVMLTALLGRLGCDVRTLGCARDDVAQIRDRIVEGLRTADALFITGGMSMGKYDHVPAILRELNVEIKIAKLRIKPGKPFVFGVHRDDAADQQRVCHVFGLPGNPVSAFVCTVRLAARLLRRLGGGPPDDIRIDAPLESALEANGPREFYQPAIFGGAIIKPLRWKGSADIFTLAQANALIVRPANDPARTAGDLVKAMMIPGEF